MGGKASAVVVPNVEEGTALRLIGLMEISHGENLENFHSK
jgi:hypothetical protein